MPDAAGVRVQSLLLLLPGLFGLPLLGGCDRESSAPRPAEAPDTLEARVGGGTPEGRSPAASGRLGRALTRPPGGLLPGRRAGGPALSYLEARGRRPRVLETARGEATFYADFFHLRRTASGELFDQREMVAAHRSYPFGTLLRVTNVSNDSSVVVRVVDRGPFAPGRSMPAVLDLSRAAAERLDFIREGRTVVRVDVLRWGEE